MTDCSEIAFGYCLKIDSSARNYFIFVNEVLESEKMQTFEFDKDMEDVSTHPKHQFEKTFSQIESTAN